MFRRANREDETEREPERARRYQMKERWFDIGDDYTIVDERGREAFRVDGKILRLRNTLVIEDLEGRPVATIREKLLSIRDQMTIERDGQTIGRLRKNLINILRDRYVLDIPGRDDITVQGDILDHEYSFTQRGERVAQVSKRWFRLRDTYGIEIGPGQDHALILAAAVAIDQIEQEEEEERRRQG